MFSNESITRELFKIILRAEKVASQKENKINEMFNGDFTIFDDREDGGVSPFDEVLTLLGIPVDDYHFGENGELLSDDDTYSRDWAYFLLGDYTSGKVSEDFVISEVLTEFKRLRDGGGAVE